MQTKKVNIILRMLPRQAIMTFKEFRLFAPPYSLTLDGIVRGVSRFDSRGPWGTLDHHEDVIRIITRAVCAQVWVFIMNGLYELYTRNGEIFIIVYVDHCDQDVCLSWTLLKHGQNKKFFESERLERLITIQDLLDTTGGMNPFPSSRPVTKRELMEIAWVFEPYSAFRVSGKMGDRNKAEFEKVVFAVEERILRHVADTGGHIDLDTRYEPFHSGPDWIIAKGVGLHSKIGILSDGFKAYALYRERPNGRFDWSIGRTALMPYNMRRFLRRMNRIDEIIDPNDLWGGGGLVSGSPKIFASNVSPIMMVPQFKQGIFQGRKCVNLL